jgi:hypothetical protein
LARGRSNKKTICTFVSERKSWLCFRYLVWSVARTINLTKHRWHVPAICDKINQQSDLLTIWKVQTEFISEKVGLYTSTPLWS